MDKLWKENLFLEYITSTIQGKMKHIYIFLIMSILLLQNVNAQTCQKTFIEELKAIWPTKIEQFSNQIKLLNKELVTKDTDSTNTIYIPQLLYHKNIKYGMKMKKEEFFCTLNPESMSFYESVSKLNQKYYFIYSYSGEILWIANNPPKAKKKYEILISLIKIYHPKHIFTIYNSDYFFLVKEDKILPFEYLHPERELDICKVIEAIIKDPLQFGFREPK